MTALSETDSELVLRAQRGEKEAFTELVRRFQDLAHGLAYHRLGDFEDARDAAQAAFIRVYQELPGLRNADAFRPWLTRIVENESRMIGRRRKPTAPLTEGLLAQSEDLHARIDLQRALDRLPEKDRLVLTLFVFQDRSLTDVASFLGITKDAVMSRLRNVRARLRTETIQLTQRTIRENRLPEDWATKLPIPYDEYDPKGLAGNEPLFPWRRDWLLGALPKGTEIAAVTGKGYEWQHAPDRPTWVELRLPGGEAKTVELRMSGRKGGIELETALLPILERLAIPAPRLVLGPARDPALPHWSPLLAVEPIIAQSAIAWALGRDIKAVDHVCDVVLDAMDLLKGATAAVEAAGIDIERASLREELERIVGDGGPWMEDARFREAMVRLKPIVAAIDLPLVLTDSGIGPNALVDDEGRFVGFDGASWARIEDPHYAITKYWTYDGYPLNRAGIVERYLVRHRLTLKDLAPRLAVRALATLQREIPVQGGDEGYRESMLGWLQKGLEAL